MIKRVSVGFAVLAVAVGGCANEASEDASDTTTTTTTTTTTEAAGEQTLTAQINTVDGRHVADTTIDFTGGYATVTVETVESGILSPGFHSMHIHAVGTCDANDAFASAGEHFQAPGRAEQPASGDLPPLLVRSDGAGKLISTTDAFTADQLKTPQGSSIVIHESTEGGMPTDTDPPRIACGVLSPASATATTPAETATETVTTTAVSPAPPATGTETPTTTAPTETTATTSPGTETTTITTTGSPTTTVTTAPPPPGG
jgi:Cu-Zn family superoxide dismutase